MALFSITSTARHRNGISICYVFEVAGIETLDDLASSTREGGLVVGRRWRVRRDESGVTLYGGEDHAITRAEISAVQMMRSADSAVRVEGGR